jgi:hypothetical protein
LLRSLIEKLEEENRNWQTKLEDQYKERATRDEQIQEIGIQVNNQSSSKRLLMRKYPINRVLASM